jgi:uncharacterized protein
MTEKDFLIVGPRNARDVVVLAHGAGAAMDSPFMNAIADGLATAAIRVVRFEFPYMRARRMGGKRGAPDREPMLLDSWREVIANWGGGPGLIIGGKSLGGRIASMVADEAGVRGLVCLGYPFHPPGRPAGPRLKHLHEIATPTLILQGAGDSFGDRAEVERYKLSPKIRIAWMEDGDHSFKPRVSSGLTQEDNLARAVAEIVEFVKSLQPSY